MCFRQLPVLVTAACFFGGCASVVDGTTEPIYITSSPEPGANCEVTNAQGSWSVITPGTVVVKRSDSVLLVHCAKAGQRDAKEYYAAKLPTAALIGAYMPFVGIVSAAVDGSSGASGEYPNTIMISMQKIDNAAEGRASRANRPPQDARAQSTSGESP